MDELTARVEALVAEGRHAQAAELVLAKGQVARAAELFVAVWKWDRAIEVSEEAGLLDVAYRHALAAKDRAACGRILAKLEARPEQAIRAAQHAEDHGLLLDAARCQLVLGEPRKAGMLYEKRIREAPEDGESALALGRILAQFGRWDHAVRALQKAAATESELEAPALKLMIACFSAMGMDEAAGSRLDALRRHQPELPVTVPEVLEILYGDERGVAAIVGQGDSDRLLAGRYRIMGPLGAGATGRVLLAHDAFHERQVAIKVLNVGGGSIGRDAFVRFGREARVAAGIDHPNVVKVYEFNPDGPFIVMEYMAGGTLEQRLVDSEDVPIPFSPEQTFAMVRSVLRALEVVHRRGVVHRDLKPANIFFAENGNVTLGDFGVAHLADLGSTMTGAMMGTLAFMAPEQITGSQRPDAATDLYALGVILFRCLTGRLPFRGPDFVAQHLEEEPPAPSAVASWLGDDFDDVIGRLLAKAPADRFASANDLLDALRPLPWARAQEGFPVRAAGQAPAAASIPPPAAESNGTRFEVIEQRADGTVVARDELLERSVELVVIDATIAERLRSYARADGPFLQAVYEVDEEAGRAVLEHPSGIPLAILGTRDPRRIGAVPQVRAALARLHEERVVHGGVRPANVVVGDARAVLRIRVAPAVSSDPRTDLVGLDALGGKTKA